MKPVREQVLTVAVADHEVVRLGVAAMLAPFADIDVVPVEPGSSPPRRVDILLVDSWASAGGDARSFEAHASDPRVGTVVLYTWALTETVVAAAKKRGVHTCLPKSLDAQQLSTALHLVHRGESEPAGAPSDDAGPTSGASARSSRWWPGRGAGLTPRESEVISLVTSGLSNGEIARETYLSINSVKSYIRSAYRSMGVTSRSQAVLWGIDNGMAPTRMSLQLPPAS